MKSKHERPPGCAIDSKDSNPNVLPTIYRTFASQIALMPVPARYSNVGS